MKLYKRILAIAIVIALVIGILPMSVFATESTYSGKCGDNVFWELDVTTGVLTVSGTGSTYTHDRTKHHNGNCQEGYCAFKEKIKEIKIEEGVTVIGEYTFSSLDWLEKVSFPSSVSEIKSRSFYNCYRLTSVVLSEGLKRIEDAFWNHRLTSISFPSTVEYIEMTAFSGYGDTLAEYIVNESNAHYKSIDGVIYSKDEKTLIMYPSGNRRVSFTIPETVTTVGESAFNEACYLKTINFGSNVTTIEDLAFFCATTLININFSDALEYIGDLAFGDCEQCESKFLYISIPKNVKHIGEYAFHGENLLGITVDPENEYYSSYNYALYNKDKTELICYPSGRVGRFEIPEGVRVITSAFDDQSKMTELYVPSSVKELGDSVDLPSVLKCIDVSKDNPYFTSVDGIVYTKDEKELQAIPRGKKEITLPATLDSIYASDLPYFFEKLTFLNPNCTITDNVYGHSYPKSTIVYGFKNSTAEQWAEKQGVIFQDLSDQNAGSIEKELQFYYSKNKDTIELSDVVNVGADYLRGNSLGMLYDGDMRWELSNPEVLQIESYSTKAALLYFKAVGLGSCDITLYLDGKKAVSDTVTVKVSDKTLLENNSEYVFNSSAFSTLEAARNTCKEIIDGNNGFHRSLASFFKSVENGLGVGVITKEALAAGGLTTSMAEDAENKAIEKIMMELIGSEDLVGSATGKIQKAYKVIKAGYSTATVNKERFFDTIVNVFDYSYDQVEELYNTVDNYKSKTDMTFDVLDVTLSALLISQFEMDTIKDMRDATSYGSALYLTLDRLYAKRANLVAYATDRFLNEQAIGKLNELIGKLGGPTYKIANIIGTWSKMIYDQVGGLDAEDYLVAQNNWGFAGYFYNYSLKVKGTPENFERYYKYYIAAVKAALKSAIDISKDYRLTNIADGLYEQIELTCHYEDYFDQVRNDLNNVCSVSKETFENGKVLACHGGGIASYSLRNTALIANEEAIAENFYNNIDPEKTISIPAYIDGSRIEGVADYGFTGLTNIQGFMLPQTIETIGEYAFANCSNAKFMYLNSGITKIGEGAFLNCAQLEVLNIPETLQVVGDTAFANCGSLGSITFGKNVTTVGAKALEGCTNLKTVYFNNASTVIAQDVFENCAGITVYGYEGSTAQALANNCGFAFVAFEDAVAEMRIITPATQQSIVSGDVVSTDGLSIEVIYMDGTKETISDGWSIVYDTTSVGVQKVYVCYKDGSVSYPITVTQKVIEEINLSDHEISLFITDSYQLIADCENNCTLDELIWSSDNEEIVTIDESGYVTALKAGSANIKVSLKDGSVYDRCKITVVNNESLVATDGYVRSQIFSPAKSGYYTFYSLGSSANITAVLYNTSGELISASCGKNVEISSWLVDDEAYYVEMQTTDGNTFTLEVSESAKAESIRISIDKFCGEIGGEHQLEVNYEPLNSLREELVWESSNEEIVSVNQFGLIKLHKEGSAVITVTSENGLFDTLAVTVEGYPIIKTAESKTVDIDQNNQYAYFRFIPDEDGYYAFYSYNSEYDTYGTILNSNMEEIKSDDDGGDGNNFKVQYRLEAGVTYILKARFWNTDNKGSFKVCVEQTKCITALEIVSMPEKTEYIKDYVSGDNISYYGLKLKATWSDGSITDWEYNFDWYIDGEYISRDAFNVQETGNVKLTCGDASVTLTFTLIDNPVAYLELVSGSSYNYVENFNGYVSTNGNGEYFYYYTNFPSDAVIKIVYKDGTSTTSKVGEYIDGYRIDWSDNQYQEPWVVGTDNKSMISYLGHTVNLPITVVENQVASIEVVSGRVTCIENTNGYQGDNGYVYWYSVPSDVMVKISYTDGTEKTVGVYDEVDGYRLSFDDNQYDEPWIMGDDNYLIVSYLGVETHLPVSVSANPVDHIVINTAPTREYVYGDVEYGYLYSNGDYEFYPTDLIGLSFTVYYTDGTSKTFTHDDIDEDDNINGYGYALHYDAYNPEIGNFPVQFEYMGKTAEYSVVLKESAVAKIEVTKQPNKTTYVDNYTPDFVGTEFTITYTDGSTKVVALSEDNLTYEYDPWWGELFYKVDVDGNQLVIESCYSEDELCYATYYLGASCLIQDITFTESKEVSSIELDNVTWNGDGMIVEVSYTDETTETIILCVADFYDYGDSSGAGFGKTENGLMYYYIETYKDEDGNVEKYDVRILGQDITVEPSNVLIGDVNSDGIVDNLDRMVLSRYLADWAEYTEDIINMAAADVNQDGIVDNLDRMVLSRHLADWEGYEELPCTTE